MKERFQVLGDDLLCRSICGGATKRPRWCLRVYGCHCEQFVFEQSTLKCDIFVTSGLSDEIILSAHRNVEYPNASVGLTESEQYAFS